MSLLAGSQGVTWTLALLYTLIVPRLLGPAGMGLIVISWSISGLAVAAAGLGVRPLLVKEVAADHSRAPRLLGNAIVVRLALLVPIAGLALVYGVRSGFHDERSLVLQLAMCLAAVTLVLDSIHGVLAGVERMGYLAATDVVNKLIATFVSIPLVLLGFGPLWLILLNLAAMCVVAGMNLFWVRGIGIDWRVGLRELLGFVRSSLAYWAFAVFYTIYLWVDTAILAAIASPREVGWYGVSTKLFQTLLFLPVILTTAWLPRLVRAHEIGGSPQLRRAAALPFQMLLVLGLPIGVGVAVVASPLINLVYGPAYAPAVPAMVFLGLTIIPMYLNIVIPNLLVAAGLQSKWTRGMVLASVVNPLLNLGLISYFKSTTGNGATGAALSMLLTELLLAALGLAMARHLIDASLLLRFARAGVAVAVMAAATVALEQVLGFLPLLVLLGAVVYCGLALPLRLVTGAEVREVCAAAGFNGLLARMGSRRLALLRRLRRTGRHDSPSAPVPERGTDCP